jgi:hypothetical protein
MIERPAHNNFLPLTQKISKAKNAVSGPSVTAVSLSGTSGDREPRQRVDSWKGIANYFRRDVRTVQRWERQEGLPVHRHAHRKSSSIYALRRELSVWWGGRDLSNNHGESQNRRRPPVHPRSTPSFPKDTSVQNSLVLLLKELLTTMLVEAKNQKAKRKTKSAASVAIFPGSERPSSHQRHTPRIKPNEPGH